MDVPDAMDMARNALLVTVFVCGPILVAGVAVGLLISVAQAVTQLQDQTISIVPKILVMAGVAMLTLPWITQHLLEYTTTMFLLN